MITTALKVMLFGMAGIFIVMGLIMGVTALLNKFSRDSKETETE